MTRHLTVRRTVGAPADAVWAQLVDVRNWPAWGPSVTGAELDGGGHRIGPGARGTVTTALGARLPFHITHWVDGVEWRWRVAGVPATGHVVRPLGPDRCEVAFEVPWWAAPYTLVCRVALGRIADISEADGSESTERSE